MRLMGKMPMLRFEIALSTGSPRTGNPWLTLLKTQNPSVGSSHLWVPLRSEPIHIQLSSASTLGLPQAKRSPGSSTSPRRRPIQAGAKKTCASTIRACVHICAEIFVHFDPFKRRNSCARQDIKIFHNSGTPRFECTD